MKEKPKTTPPKPGSDLTARVKTAAKERLTPKPYVPKVDPVFENKRKD